MYRALLPLVALLIVVPLDAAATFTPVRHVVNTTIYGNQSEPGVAFDENGGSIVIWTSGYGFLTERPIVRRFDPSGEPTSGEIALMAPGATSAAWGATLCHRDGGGWIAVWTAIPRGNSRLDDPDTDAEEGVFAQLLAEDGAPFGDRLRVSSIQPKQQGYSLGLSCLPGGGFFVAWRSDDQDGSFGGVFGRYFNAAGIAVGQEFQVNTESEGEQSGFGGLRVDSSRSGRVLVAWTSGCAGGGGPLCAVEPDGSQTSVQARLFDSNGVPAGPEFRVNTTTVGAQGGGGLAVSFDESEGFLVVYTSENETLVQCFDAWPCYDLLAQRFDALGNRLGAEFAVNSAIRGNQIRPVVARDDDDGFLIAWEVPGHRAPPLRGMLVGRHFDAFGVASGGDVRLADDDDSPRYPAIARFHATFMLVWAALDARASFERDIYARRMSALPTCPASPSAGCAVGENSLISMREGSRQARLSWSSSATGTAEDGEADPMTGYSLCLYDDDDALIARSVANPFADGTGDAQRSPRAKPGDASSFVVRSLRIRQGQSGTRIRMIAAGEAAPAPRETWGRGSLTAQLVSGEGACWQSNYADIDVTSKGFRARSR